MSSPINYLFQMPGKEFNRLLVHSFPHLDEPFEVAWEAGSWLWESRLPCSDMGLTANLTGSWTLLYITERYSLVRVRPEEFKTKDQRLFIATKQAKLRQWEECLLGLVGNVKMYRIDDKYMDEWGAKHDYRWLHVEHLIEDFLNWLHQQDGDWSILNDGIFRE